MGKIVRFYKIVIMVNEKPRSDAGFFGPRCCGEGVGSYGAWLAVQLEEAFEEPTPRAQQYVVTGITCDDPLRQVNRVVEYLGITTTEEQMERAVSHVWHEDSIVSTSVNS